MARESRATQRARSAYARATNHRRLGLVNDETVDRARSEYVDAKALDFARQILSLPISPGGRLAAAAMLVNGADP